jgi:hypothetical protein
MVFPAGPGSIWSFGTWTLSTPTESGPGMSVRNINDERGPHGRSRPEGLAADLPGAGSGQDGSEAKEDRRLLPLEGQKRLTGQ